jgi:hypothetical protein
MIEVIAQIILLDETQGNLLERRWKLIQNQGWEES